jgi:hypothetical protein
LSASEFNDYEHAHTGQAAYIVATAPNGHRAKSDLIPILKNNAPFERVKAPRFDDRKSPNIVYILGLLRSSNPDSFHALKWGVIFEDWYYTYRKKIYC